MVLYVDVCNCLLTEMANARSKLELWFMHLQLVSHFFSLSN